MRVEIAAPAKINLFLKVLSRRPDGYHELFSWMHKLDLADRLVVEEAAGGVELSCPGSGLPEDDGNLVYRAAVRFFAETGIRAGARIILEKRIPMAAGLGGGSSDAAACLLALNRIFGSALAGDRLAEMALSLGADVPLFVRQGASFWCEGVGERLSPAPHLGGFSILLVNPGFAVETAWVYRNLPLTSMGNTYNLAPEKKDELARRWRERSGRPPLPFPLENDLETVTLSRHPVIGEIKEKMLARGAAASLMSGSGPTVFGLFADREEAEAAALEFRTVYSSGVILTAAAF